MFKSQAVHSGHRKQAAGFSSRNSRSSRGRIAMAVGVMSRLGFRPRRILRATSSDLGSLESEHQGLVKFGTQTDSDKNTSKAIQTD